MSKPLFRDDPTVSWEGTVGPEWMRICDHVREPIEAWAAVSPRNAKIRKIAVFLSGVERAYADTVVLEQPRERLSELAGQIVFTCAGLTVPWTKYVLRATELLDMVESVDG